MTNIDIGAPNRARHRNDMVDCPGCERRIARKSRQQIYCSSRCRSRAHYGKNGRTAIISSDPCRDTELLTHPYKKQNDFNVLQWSKSVSNARIHGPRRVIEAEVFAGREWHDEISADGVRCEVGRLRKRALLTN